MSAQEFLVAYATFKVKGQQDVMAKAKEIEKAIAGIQGVGEIKMKVSGVEKVEGAVNSLKQKFAQLAQGGDLTRMLSGSIEEAFKTAGEGTMGLAGGLVGGMFGGLIGGMAANFAGEAAKSLLALPQKLEQQNFNRQLEDWRHGEENPNEPAKLRKSLDLGANQSQFETWRNTALGYTAVHAGSEKLRAENNLSRDSAIDLTNQLGAITERQGGNAEEFTSMVNQYSTMRQLGDLTRLPMFIRQHAEINKEMRAYWERAHGGAKGEAGDVGYEKFLQSGKIGPSLMDAAIAEAGRKSAHALEIDKASRAHIPWWNSYGPNWGSNPQDYAKYQQSRGLGVPGPKATIGGEPISMYSAGFGEGTGIPSGLERAGGKNKEYGFTSIAGLAEKMQEAASGESDASERSATALETIVRDGVKINDPRHPGTPEPGHAH